MLVKGLVITDLHFGVSAPAVSARMSQELEQVFKFLNENSVDVIHINGDFFDKELKLGDMAVLLALEFYNRLKEVCIEKKIKLRILHGTEGHDKNQTAIFETLDNDDLDLKVIYNVEDEELFPGFNVLYIPEESVMDQDEYYKYYKSKKYETIQGHGTWDFAAAKPQIIAANRTDVSTSPVFITEEWENTLAENGFVIFGHIHKRVSRHKKFYYPGSFSAWNFTDISKRGFAYYTYDTETKHRIVRMVDNVMCPVYETLKSAKLDFDINTVDLLEIEGMLQDIAKDVDYFRLDISDVPTERFEAIKKIFKGNPKISIKDENVKEQVDIEKSTLDDTTLTKYKYIIDDIGTIYEIILKFIQSEMDNYKESKEITLEEIMEILKSDEIKKPVENRIITEE